MFLKTKIEIVQCAFYKWRNIFSSGPLDIGHTNLVTKLVQHEIHLDEPRPFKDPYRTVPHGLIEEVA